ncbi:MAG: hypothetical protein GF368_02235 [Candidatus Aenigmarchaeota archaeon]|nr:hypothetical protein [Candidatus Aenigmarchaeota archaeon]
MFYIVKRDGNRTAYEMLLEEMRKDPNRAYRSRYLARNLGIESQEIGEELAKMRDYGIATRSGKSWYLSE